MTTPAEAILRMRAAMQRGDMATAESAAAQILQHERDPEAMLVRAISRWQLGRKQESAADFDTLVQWAPQWPTAHANRALLLEEMGDLKAAIESSKRALALDPRHLGALCNLSSALLRHGEEKAALEAANRAMAVAPGDTDALLKRGSALAALGQFDEAWDMYNRAEAGRRNDTDRIRYMKALFCLISGKYPEGFAYYAHRFAMGVAARKPNIVSSPQWRGEKQDGVLRIWSEQGIGDQLLFLQLLPAVLERAPNVVLDCDPRLEPLLRRSYPQLTDILAPGETYPGATTQIAMGDLGAALGATAEGVAVMPQKIKADPEKTAAIRARYQDLANGRPIIGIAWSSPRGVAPRPKSAPLGGWESLLRNKYFFVSLQYGDARADIENAQAKFGCRIHQDATIDQMRSIDDFAAQIAALDHLVTVSNTTAHVAGAIGARGVVLVPSGAGLLWYWGARERTTPWYRSLTLVRRKVDETWTAPIAMAAALVRDETRS